MSDATGDAASDASAADASDAADVGDADAADSAVADSATGDADGVDGSTSCGNGVIDRGELCDRNDLGGASCGSLGFDANGVLDCNADCDAFIIDNCLPQCGDGVVDSGEACDETAFGDGNECQTLGFDGGSLSCTNTCMSIDVSGCTTSEVCGNDTIGGPELCDGSDLGLDPDGLPVTCESFGFAPGGVLGCRSDCATWDLADCGQNLPGWTCPPAYYADGSCDCGCGVPDPDCDGGGVPSCIFCNDVGSCATTLGCGAIAPYDTGVCIGTVVDCGDGVASPGEACDGADTRARPALDRGFAGGGTLGCSADCQALDAGSCESTSAPDGWLCDPDYYGDGGCDCGCGVQDVDCASSDTVDDCDYCLDCPGLGGCADIIDPDDTTQCLTPVPAGWTCNAGWYFDGGCDCGCGVQDVDCAGTADVAECSYCADCGGGAELACADLLDPSDTTRCLPTDCGDGVAQGLEACDEEDLRGADCTTVGVFDGGQLRCDAECGYDTSLCTGGIPEGWACDASWYGDDGCDCGCGAKDKDCAGTTDVGECAYCTACGGSNDLCDRIVDGGDTTQCIHSTCGDGAIEGLEECEGHDFGGVTCASLGYLGGDLACVSCAIDVQGCVVPPVPAAWTCDETYYHDGDCDCGCGARDIDCPVTMTVSLCAYCLDCGQDATSEDCSGYVDPDDTTQCLAGSGVPTEWTCSATWYGDGSCDCGCGAKDLDCTATDDLGECAYCIDCGVGPGVTCTINDVNPSNTTLCARDHATPPDGWSCDATWYGDSFCDCGCGALDFDCAAVDAPAQCDYCIACGGPSGEDCAPWVDAADTRFCAPHDCGNDVAETIEACDGSDVRGATCRSEGYASGDLGCAGDCSAFDTTSCVPIVVPPTWTCNAGWFGDGSCDCGCGAVDLDCAGASDPGQCDLCLACGAGCADDCAAYVRAADTTVCATTCGDGVRVAALGEECDDGWTDAGDGCSPTCTVEPGWSCSEDAAPTTVELPALVRDFHAAHPDFATSFVGADPGIVAPALVAGELVYAPSGAGTTPSTSGAANFDQWFHSVADTNLLFAEVLPLTTQPSGALAFSSALYTPLDERGFGNEGEAHNFAFTVEARLMFAYQGTEVMTFTASDDLWVFVNDKLAVDQGGTHAAAMTTVTLDAAGAATYGLEPGKVYRLSIFHAERRSGVSDLGLELSGFAWARSVCTPPVP
ncbi:MAG: fibro-slime domain-containing protein [Myxococcota bacterium]